MLLLVGDPTHVSQIIYHHQYKNDDDDCALTLASPVSLSSHFLRCCGW